MCDERLRILAIAPGCDETDVGESWSAFQWVSGLAAKHDVTVLTLRRRDRQACASQLPQVDVVEWDDFPFVGKHERLNSMLKPGYVLFYAKARNWMKRALRSGRHFDIVHQFTPIALRYPSPAAGLGIPLILGPVAGGLDTPSEFRRECGTLPWYTKLRNTDRFRMAYDPWLRNTYASAQAVIGVAPYVHEQLKHVPLHRFHIATETGVTSVSNSPRTLPKSGPIKLLYVGRVVRNKGVRDLVRAFKELDEPSRFELHIVGDGEDLEACRGEADSSRILFHGQVSREQVYNFYRSSHLFVFPSLREPSGNVVLEALSNGLPCIVCDRGGPGYAIDPSCGVKVPPTTPTEFACGIARAIEMAAEYPNRFTRLSLGALNRVRQIGIWEQKVEWLGNLYREVLAEQSGMNRVRTRKEFAYDTR